MHLVELVYKKYCNWLDTESCSEWSLPCLLSKGTVRQKTRGRTRGEREALSPLMSRPSRGDQLRSQHTWNPSVDKVIRVGFHPIWPVFLQEEGKWIQTHWENTMWRHGNTYMEERLHVKMETENEILLPQTKGHPGLSEAGKGKEGSSPRHLEGRWPCQCLDFGRLHYGSWRKHTHGFCWVEAKTNSIFFPPLPFHTYSVRPFSPRLNQRVTLFFF